MKSTQTIDVGIKIDTAPLVAQLRGMAMVLSEAADKLEAEKFEDRPGEDRCRDLSCVCNQEPA